MHILQALTFFAAATSALVVSRDVAETRANLQAVDGRVRTLTNSLNGWDGSALGALGINGAIQALETEIKDATADLSDETVASSADSRSVISYVTGTLEPDIVRSLVVTENAEGKFRSGGFIQIAQDSVARLRTASATYSDGLIRVSSADVKPDGQAAKARIDARFAQTQTALAS